MCQKVTSFFKSKSTEIVQERGTPCSTNYIKRNNRRRVHGALCSSCPLEVLLLSFQHRAHSDAWPDRGKEIKNEKTSTEKYKLKFIKLKTSRKAWRWTVIFHHLVIGNVGQRSRSPRINGLQSEREGIVSGSLSHRIYPYRPLSGYGFEHIARRH